MRERGDRDLEAERVIAGTLLLYPELADELPVPSVEAFTAPGLGALVRHLVARGDRGVREVADMLELEREIGAETWSALGGLEGVGRLAERTAASRAALGRHYQRLETLAAIRRLAAECLEVAEDAREAVDPDAFLDRAASRLSPLVETTRPQPVRMVGELSSLVLRELLEGQQRGIPTGYHAFDRLTTGLGRGNLVVVAGRPSMGKSVLGLALALGTKLPTIVFQLEMRDRQLVTRMLCSAAGVDMTRARHGRLTDSERADLVRGEGKLRSLQVGIADRPDQTISEIRSRARAFVRAHRRKMLDGSPTDCIVVVDYLQLVRPSDTSMPREQQVAEMSRGFKTLALELDVPVVLIAQLNRDVDRRSEPRPMLADLRESGAIEQDADDILFIWRPERYEHTNKPDVRGLAEVIVAKQRMGPCGAFWLHFDGKFCAVRNHGEDA